MTIREKIFLSLFDIRDTKVLNEIAEFIAKVKQENNKSQLSISPSPIKNSKEQFYKAFGSWKGEESAEELANDIRNSRYFNRQIESL